MPMIAGIRPVLLSAPYSNQDSSEILIHLTHGLKTAGLVEVTLEDGTTGLGEAYLAAFAPKVFVAIANLLTPCLAGRDAFDINARYRDMCGMCDYWSLQGAARHVIGACEIALVDAKAKSLGVPAYALLGGKQVDSIQLYGSGGDSRTQDAMRAELDSLKGKGIEIFKMRSRNHELAKTVWTLQEAASMGLRVAVDMGQNLVNPAQTVSDVVRFVNTVHARADQRIVFIEEALGPMDADNYPLLRSKLDVPICGGEIVTTAVELCRRVERNLYDFVQPDATVIGGIGQTMDIFHCCRRHGSHAVVHAWGGAISMMANYHAALAGGGILAEWPMPAFPLRDELLVEPLPVRNGRLFPPEPPGLGVTLRPEIEANYPFREEAVYQCAAAPGMLTTDAAWRR